MQLFKWTCPLLALLIFAGSVFAQATGQGKTGTHPEKPVVYVGIKPVAWLARELSCDRIEVRTLLPDGADPHTFEATARQITQLSTSQGYASINLPFERRLKTGSVPIFNLQKTGSVPDHETGTYHDLEFDPHVWLTPDGMLELAKNLGAAMDEIDAEGTEKRRAVFSALEKRLAAMDEDFKEMFAPYKGMTIVSHHPSWARFAARYGLRLEAIEEEGREPSTRRLVQLIEDARKHGVKTVFAEPQFSRRTAEAFARQLGGEVVVIDPLSGDWETNIRAAAKAFAAALEVETAE